MAGERTAPSSILEANHAEGRPPPLPGPFIHLTRIKGVSVMVRHRDTAINKMNINLMNVNRVNTL